ncbi:uncharacterized conserved protein [Longilinea arvoryzae]|uniref:Uncharacterized conserved protein n=1 Tax=Longilinea arvoryzae TaxID=360412 RepID=A0A0S7BDL6_9CHLR|nr:DUF362 domain-containing protein [Longilinea arvoryzae]GAP13449.1 uncharacterized conserved protein [Longilinea arvoryzae]
MAKLDRRKFIKITGWVTSAGLARILAPGLLVGSAAACQAQPPAQPPTSTAGSQSIDPTATVSGPATALPPTNTAVVQPSPTAGSAPKADFGPRVVHVRAGAATKWSGQERYWEHVDPQVVGDMVDRGLQALTGQSTSADAWRRILSNYQPGQGIVIKLNFNNTLAGNCSAVSGQINALPQPANAVVAGLKSIGVDEQDIWFYDGVNRYIPEYFAAGIRYGNVQFFDKCHQPVTYDSRDADAIVSFSPPQGIPTPASEKIADVLVRARYLINMPILKNHDCAGISLGFKNHFGTVDNPGGMHGHVFLVSACGGGFYSNYSPLVDLNQNAHIRQKTVLTIGDGLCGARGSQEAWPSAWSTFGGSLPNSLFFSTDPVALDCVMADHLRAEPGAGVMAGADEYLKFAQDAGMGVYERGDPWGGGYQRIDYQKIVY